MDTASAALLLAALSALPSPNPYPQLPSEAACEQCFRACERDRWQLDQQIEASAGWRRAQLVDARHEAERLHATWYAAWWVTWSRTSDESRTLWFTVPPGGQMNWVEVPDVSERDEWAGALVDLIGPDAFWRGDLPLPLSAR